MSLLGDGEKPSIPSLSWDSVVDPDALPSDPIDEPSEGVAPPQAAAVAPTPVASEAFGRSSLLRDLADADEALAGAEPISLGVEPQAPELPVAPSNPPSIASDPTIEPAPEPQPTPVTPAPSAPTVAPVASASTVAPVASADAAPVASATVAPVASATVPMTQPSVPEPVVAAAASPAPPAPAPAPVAAVPAAAPVFEPGPTIDPTPTAAPQPVAAPAMSTVQQVPTVPTVAPPAAVPVGRHDPAPYHVATTTPASRRRRQQGGGNGIGLVLTLVVLAGLIAAGFVYGRPYLFPDDFDDLTQPYAEAIETARGVPIAEPFVVIDAAPLVHLQGFDAQALGAEWAQDIPMWRAFGLASQSFAPNDLSTLGPERPGAYYSLADGQIHTDAPLVKDLVDPGVARSAAAAVLDQNYRWSLAVDGQSTERDSVIEALVLAESDRIRQEGGFPGTVATDATAAELAELPPLLAHRLVAAELYSRVVGVPSSSDEARMRALESYGAALPANVPLSAGPAPTLAEGETVAGEVRTMDRDFWYLVFAAHLPASIANDFATELTGASLTPVRAPGGTACWAATLVAPTAEVGFFFNVGLTDWVAAAPESSSATTSVVDATVVELRTCDPGPTAASSAPVVTEPAVEPIDATLVRSLQAYRTTELAVVAALNDAGADTAAVTQALTELASSTIGDDLALLAPTMTDAQLAAAAVERVQPIVQPSAAAPPADG